VTDERLRELEQRWKASGSPEDEAAYLLERVRTGDLEKEKLELAAYCGHEGARLALGDEAPVERGGRGKGDSGRTKGARARSRRAKRIETWIVGLQSAFPEAASRVGLALATLACQFTPQPEQDQEIVRRAVDQHSRGVREPKLLGSPSNTTAGAVLRAVLGLGLGLGNPDLRLASQFLRELLCAEGLIELPPHERLPRAEALVRSVVKTHLVPWALGLDDPLSRTEEPR
jgi:hypothetical protein